MNFEGVVGMDQKGEGVRGRGGFEREKPLKNLKNTAERSGESVGITTVHAGSFTNHFAGLRKHNNLAGVVGL